MCCLGPLSLAEMPCALFILKQNFRVFHKGDSCNGHRGNLSPMSLSLCEMLCIYAYKTRYDSWEAVSHPLRARGMGLLFCVWGGWFWGVTWLLVSISSPKRNKWDLFERKKPCYSGSSFGQTVDLNLSNFCLHILPWLIPLAAHKTWGPCVKPYVWKRSYSDSHVTCQN